MNLTTGNHGLAATNTDFCPTIVLTPSCRFGKDLSPEWNVCTGKAGRWLQFESEPKTIPAPEKAFHPASQYHR
jgi:hypothetical protein